MFWFNEHSPGTSYRYSRRVGGIIPDENASAVILHAHPTIVTLVPRTRLHTYTRTHTSVEIHTSHCTPHPLHERHEPKLYHFRTQPPGQDRCHRCSSRGSRDVSVALSSASSLSERGTSFARPSPGPGDPCSDAVGRVFLVKRFSF